MYYSALTKIEGNEKCHASPRVLASVVFRYSGIPPLFRGVSAIPLVFRIPLFRVPLFRRYSVVPRVFRVTSFRVPVFLVLQYAFYNHLKYWIQNLPLKNDKLSDLEKQSI